MRRRSAAAARRSIHWPSGLRQKCALKVSDRQCYTFVLVERLVLEDDPSASKPPSTKATDPRAFSSCAIWGFVARGQGGVAAGAPRHQSSSAQSAETSGVAPRGRRRLRAPLPGRIDLDKSVDPGVRLEHGSYAPLSDERKAILFEICLRWYHVFAVDALRYPRSRTWWSSTFPQAIPHRNGSRHIQFPLSYTQRCHGRGQQAT